MPATRGRQPRTQRTETATPEAIPGDGSLSNVVPLDRGGRGPEWWDGCDAIPTGYKVPDPYEVERAGIWTLREGKDGAERVPVTSAPVALSANLV